METPDSQTRMAIALGSGAARGLAHIGVLRALAEAGRMPAAVAGTSIGAVVGGAFAAGRLNALSEFVSGLDWRKSAHLFLEASFPRSGLIEGRKIEEILRQLLGRCDISELPIPFRAVATDVETGQEVVIDEGDLVSAIRASISVPGIFCPARRKGAHLVDGGLVNPVPVNVARALGGAGVIAVNVSRGLVSGWWRKPSVARRQPRWPPADAGGRRALAGLAERATRRTSRLPVRVREWLTRDAAPNIFEVLGGAVLIMEERIAEMRLRIDPPDLLIQPNVGHIRFFDFHRAAEVIAEGYRAAKEALSQWIPAGSLSAGGRKRV